MGLIYTSYRGRGEEIGRELPEDRDYYNTIKGMDIILHVVWYVLYWYGSVSTRRDLGDYQIIL